MMTYYNLMHSGYPLLYFSTLNCLDRSVRQYYATDQILLAVEHMLTSGC